MFFIGIDEADKFIAAMQRLQEYSAEGCRCDVISPCWYCEAAEDAERSPAHAAYLIVGIGAAIRRGLPTSAYEEALLPFSERTLDAGVARFRTMSLDELLGRADDCVMADLKGTPTAGRYGTEDALIQLVMEREDFECLTLGVRHLLKTRRGRNLKKRLRRIIQQLRAFDDIASGTRSLLRIDDFRGSLRETIVVKGDWWLYRYDGCVFHPDDPALTDDEKAHVASCPDCGKVLDGIGKSAALIMNLSTEKLLRLKERIMSGGRGDNG